LRQGRNRVFFRIGRAVGRDPIPPAPGADFPIDNAHSSCIDYGQFRLTRPVFQISISSRRIRSTSPRERLFRKGFLSKTNGAVSGGFRPLKRKRRVTRSIESRSSFSRASFPLFFLCAPHRLSAPRRHLPWVFPWGDGAKVTKNRQPTRQERKPEMKGAIMSWWRIACLVTVFSMTGILFAPLSAPAG